MEDSLDHNQKPLEVGLNSEKLDLTLNEEELEQVVGGNNATCGEVGFKNSEFTKTGFSGSSPTGSL